MELQVMASYCIETEDGFKVHPRVIELLKAVK